MLAGKVNGWVAIRAFPRFGDNSTDRIFHADRGVQEDLIEIATEVVMSKGRLNYKTTVMRET